MILTVLDSINNFLEMARLDDEFSRAFIIVIIMIAASIVAYKAGANSVTIIVLNTILILLGTVIGFIPMWVVLAIIMVITLYAIMIITDIPMGGSS